MYEDEYRVIKPHGAQGLGEKIAGFWNPRRLAFPIFLIICLYYVFMGWSAGLVDPDYYWHLAAGNLILDQGTLPKGDPFSWTFEGKPWVLHEWLFQVALALWHRTFGQEGVALATAVLLALPWYIAFATADRLIKRPALTFGLAIAFGAGIAAVGAPRPHLVSILFFAITLAVFFRAKYEKRYRGLMLLPVLMILWVNMHGGYFLGLAIIAAFAGMEWLNLLSRRRYRQQIWLCLWLTGIAAACIAASALNPDGIEHWKYPLYVAQLDLVSQINEWQSIMTSPARGLWYAGGALIFFILLLGGDRRLDTTELLFPCAVFLAGLIQARHAPFATLTFLCFAGIALGKETEEHPSPKGVLALSISWLLAVAALIVPAVFFVRSAYFEAARQIMPSDVVAYIKENDINGRMFNDYDIGGYLINELYPERKVFIDGRADLYGDAFYKAFANTLHGTQPLALHFDQWEIDYAVIPQNAALTQLLLLRGDFQIAYRGRRYAVLVRK